MKTGILEKIITDKGDINCESFSDLTDQEILVIAEMYDIGSGRTREELCQELVKEFEQIKKTTEGHMFSFNQDGTDYSFNIEYLTKHLSTNEFIPYTKLQMSPENRDRLVKEFKEYLINIRSSGKHLIVNSIRGSLLFNNYSEMATFLRKEYTEQIEKQLPFDGMSTSLFGGIIAPDRLIVINGEKYFENSSLFNEFKEDFQFKFNNIGEIFYKTIDIEDEPVLVDSEILFGVENLKNKLMVILHDIAKKQDIENLITNIQFHYELDYLCLFKELFPEKVQDLHKKAVDSGKSLPMYDFCFNSGTDETESFFRSVIMVNMCNETSPVVIQQFSKETPNDPVSLLTLGKDDQEKCLKIIETTESTKHFITRI